MIVQVFDRHVSTGKVKRAASASTEVADDASLAREHTNFDQALAKQYGPEQSHTVCLRSTGRVVNESTGATLPVLCRSKDCVSCNRLHFQRDLRDATRLTRPHQMLLLTGLPPAWPETQAKMKNLLRRLKRDDYTVALAYAVEANPLGTGQHLHGWLRDCAAPQAVWSEHAHAVGLGFGRLKPVTHDRDFGYITKAAVWNSESLHDHLRLNGHHRLHVTRGFWRDASTSQAYGSMREAAAAWRGLPARDRSAWVFQSCPGRRLGALAPGLAARIRAANQAPHGFSLVSPGTGEVLVALTGPPHSGPLGQGEVGPLVLTLPDRRTLLATPDGVTEVERVAA